MSTEPGNSRAIRLQKKEKRKLLVAIAILLILGISYYLLRPIAEQMRMKDFITGPSMLLQLCLLPIIWLVFGWTMMQTLRILGVARPSKSKFAKAIHLVSWAVVLLYTALMLPLLIEIVKSSLQALEYKQNPSLFPNGLQYANNIPIFFQKIEMQLMSVTYTQPIMFIFPSIIFWLSKPSEKREK